MNQFQTLRGNLVRFKRYYASFYKLNEDKENKDYLGYPFVKGNNPVGSQNHIDFFCFEQVMGIHGIRIHALQLDWAYHFICNCFKNKTQHKLAIFVLFITKTMMHKDPDSFDTHTVNHMCRCILKHEAYFLTKIEHEDNYDDTWEPNA